MLNKYLSFLKLAPGDVCTQKSPTDSQVSPGQPSLLYSEFLYTYLDI